MEKGKWLEEPKETVRPTSSCRLPLFSPEIEENPLSPEKKKNEIESEGGRPNVRWRSEKGKMV